MNALPARGRRVSHSVRRRLVALAMLMGVIGSLAWASVAGGTPSSEKYDALIVRDEPVAWFRVGDPAGSSTIEDAVSAHTYTAANSGVVLGGNGPFSGSGSGSFASGAYASPAGQPLVRGDRVHPRGLGLLGRRLIRTARVRDGIERQRLHVSDAGVVWDRAPPFV